MKYQTISRKQFFSCERRDLLCSHSNGDIFTYENNRLFSRVNARKLTWYFIGVYIINRILDGRLEMRNFSSRVENISLVHCAHSWNIFQHSKRNFVSPRNHIISSIYCMHWLFTKISGDVTENFGRHNSGFGLHDFGRDDFWATWRGIYRFSG